MFALIEPMRPAAIGDIQCSAALRTGKQCHYAAEDGELYCRKHRELSPHKRFEYATAMHMPTIPRSEIFSLTEEVRLLKQLIAARVGRITDENSLILTAGPVADMLTKLQKLVDAAVKLETAKGELISREAAMALIASIMTVVADVVVDVDLIDQIHDRMQELL
jgi:hypothetical protein